ncbi:MAG: DUF2066 domain-containing protein [Hyphomicrobiales bacterium]|nr:DUF2066 domain-containing protein [Hyphomicrobiales bacterium]
MRRLFFLLVWTAIFAAGSAWTPVRADELYIVRDISVDVSDISAVTARQKAIQEAQILGFYRLLRRITLKEDRSKLPRLSFEDIQPMINSIEIEYEKTSSTRYIASITVSFIQDALRDFFSGSDIGFLEVSPPTTLVLPLYFDETGWSLWRDSNPWWNAWRDLNPNLLSIPYLLPLADLEDRLILPADAIDDISRLDRLEQLAQRYEVDRILLARIRPDNSQVDVDVSIYKILTENFKARHFAQFNFVTTNMNKAVTDITTQIENNWKKQSIQIQDAPSTFRLRANFKNIQEWTKMRKQLETAPYIRTLQIEEINVRNAWLQLGFNGKGKTLVDGLRRNGFLVSQENSIWTLRLLESSP